MDPRPFSTWIALRQRLALRGLGPGDVAEDGAKDTMQNGIQGIPILGFRVSVRSMNVVRWLRIATKIPAMG